MNGMSQLYKCMQMLRETRRLTYFPHTYTYVVTASCLLAYKSNGSLFVYFQVTVRVNAAVCCENVVINKNAKKSRKRSTNGFAVEPFSFFIRHIT